MGFTYFITKDGIEWLDDYDESKVNSIIKNVQRGYIKPLFPNYYEYLTEKLDNGGLNKQDEHVMDEYIKPMMSILCENELHLKGSYKITPVGSNTETGDNFERFSSSEKNALITNNKQTVDTYKSGMLVYMTARKAVFPDFLKDYECMYNEGVEAVFGMTTVTGAYTQNSLYD